MHARRRRDLYNSTSTVAAIALDWALAIPRTRYAVLAVTVGRVGRWAVLGGRAHGAPPHAAARRSQDDRDARELSVNYNAITTMNESYDESAFRECKI